ncbi:hypothetical protein ACFQFC_30955 [Amorphoplanes digitatis]|uniref:Uncharacterized protein n=1 Tax=Actinoplanes digitatis TaxID=1868 RepID=A0A7W7HTM1_9ACTN|nr:hypothetical protein [Actinoplanes digitatis]MBB4760577.1 hypothetical protein [Actinoplanes digitatis]GID97129.1 hypothetical protein Adi01nite_65410 [Actinoplanes digitatis]
MTKTLVVAEMALREISRRRGVLILLALLPLAFYYSRRGEAYWQSVRFVSLGIGWTLSTAALFAGSAARGIEPRLRIAGYATHQLYLGRLAALWTVGLTLALPYYLLILVDLDGKVRNDAIALILVLTVAVAPPLGLAVAALLPRELEGMLVLLTIVAMQMMLDPEKTTAHALPFWFTREIGTYAVESDAGTDHVGRGLAHAGTTLAVVLAVVALATTLRLRRRSHISVA